MRFLQNLRAITRRVPLRFTRKHKHKIKLCGIFSMSQYFISICKNKLNLSYEKKIKQGYFELSLRKWSLRKSGHLKNEHIKNEWAHHFRSDSFPMWLISKWPIFDVIDFLVSHFWSDRFLSDSFSKWSIFKWLIFVVIDF